MNSARILVVDDEKADLLATCRVLKNAGYEVFSAETGSEGLRLTREHKPDLLLLDVNLPDISGLEVCRQLKAEMELRNVFIVMLSSVYIDSDSQANGLESGADGYVTRPIANRELLARVEALLRIKAAEQALKKYSESLEVMVAERTQELRAVQEKLVRQEKLAVLGQMAGSVSHELRSPLSVISNAIYFLKMVQPEASEKVREYLGIIEAETHNAEKIISDLLDFSRIKSVDVEPVVVSELVSGTLERFPPPENVQVTLNLPENLPTVYVDPRQVMQVLGNLVLNACQAMPQGGELSINSEVQNEMVSIIVKDTGSGITPENMKKLFEPLFTTKPKGIGLGLAVSQKLIEANGGHIKVESEAGKGSTFTVYLPVK